MAKPKVKNIINILTTRPSLESEFAVETAIAELSTIKDIDELRQLASELARINHKQSHFIANALEIMCTQQEMLNFQETRRKVKKKRL